MYLVFSTELRQLVKFPILVDHYLEHKRITPSITFIDYLAEHYFEDISNHADYERDKSLPFKSIDSSPVYTFVLIPKIDFSLTLLLPSTAQKMIIQDGQWPSLINADCIWQPPRLV